MSFALPAPVISALEEGRQAYVAVPAGGGPHVTPELYAWSGGRLWFAAASSTLKASVLGRRPHAGAAVIASSGTVILQGEVDVFDLRDPVGLVRSAGMAPATTLALARYTARNVTDLLAFGVDTVAGRLGRGLPPTRVLFALRPTAVAHVVNDTLTGAWGGWQGTGPEGRDDHVVPAGGEQAVAAFPGPVPLPARWFPDQDVAYVAPPLLALLSLPPVFPVAVVADTYRAPGPAAKHGVLVRGQGRRAPGNPGYFEIDAERIVEWDGVETRRLATA